MSASKPASRREVPPWALAAIVLLSVVVLGYFGWQAFTGHGGDPGPPKKVYPGMYDLRAEAAKMRNAKGTGASEHGP